MVKNILARIFSCKYMVKPEHVKGDLPDTKEAYKITMRIAWPSIVESVFVCLIASVDTMMVGGLGPEAIAAVGITNQPRFILMAIILSLNVGVTAVVARRKGAKDMDGANRCLKQALLISSSLGLVIAVIGILFARPLMVFAGAHDEVIDISVRYFQIIMVGVFFNSINLTINAAQRGIGNTKVSLRTNLAANVVNLIMNFFLINGIWIFPRWEVAGAAVATVIGNFVALVMAIFSICKKEGFLYVASEAPWRFDKKTISSIVSISGSAMVEQVFLRIGFFVYAKMVAELGTIAFATHQICMNILNLSFGFADGFSVASSSLVGQSLGAKRPDKAMLFGSITQRIALIFSTILFFIFVFGREFLVGLFNSDPAIIAQGAVIMIIIASITHAQNAQVILSGALRGAGDTKYVALVSFISIAIVRPLLTWLLCFPMGFGLYGAWIAVFIDQYLRLIFVFTRFRSGKWMNIEI